MPGCALLKHQGAIMQLECRSRRQSKDLPEAQVPSLHKAAQSRLIGKAVKSIDLVPGPKEKEKERDRGKVKNSPKILIGPTVQLGR